MDGVPHHLLNILQPQQIANVHLFQGLAIDVIQSICQRKKTPVIVGGTHFYLESVLFSGTLPTSPALPQEQFEQHSSSIQLSHRSAYDALKERDPETASMLHPNDFRKIQRALQLTTTTAIQNIENVTQPTSNMFVLGGLVECSV